MLSEAILLSFRIHSPERALLATILDSSPVISLFYLCIILTWYNNLVSPSCMVSASYWTPCAYFLCSFNEWDIDCFWLRTVSPRSHISTWQASWSLFAAISSYNALTFPIYHCLISSSIFSFSDLLFSSGTLFVYFWNAFLFVTHHHCQLCCWRLYHSLLSFQTQPSLLSLRD